MLKLDVIRLLEEQGHSRYWLWKQLDMSYANFNKMITNETRSIRYQVIEDLCQILYCSPNDLFRVEDE